MRAGDSGRGPARPCTCSVHALASGPASTTRRRLASPGPECSRGAGACVRPAHPGPNTQAQARSQMPKEMCALPAVVPESGPAVKSVLGFEL